MTYGFETRRPRSAARRTFLQGLGAACVGLTFAPRGARAAEEPKLNFYNWDTYIGETTLEDFKTASGIDVNLSLFSGNDELYSKLSAGNAAFDVIVPGSEMVERMAQSDMLLPLDHAKIPNFKNIAPEFQDASYDPKRKFSMPYTWLVTGIGYRKSKVKNIPDSWKDLFDSDQYKDRIAIMSDAGELFRAGFKYLGKSVNDTSPENIKAVEALLAKQRANIKAFHDDSGQDLLLSGEVDLVMEYNGDIAQVMAEDNDIGFVVPKEGSVREADCLAIPKGAPHPDNAHTFINYLLDAKVSAEISNSIKYPSPNAAAIALMPDDYKTNTCVFPPPAALEKCEYARYPGAGVEKLFDEALARLRAS